MVQQSPRRLELTVTADQAGEKIDTLLRRELRLSGTVIRRVKWLDDGILLDGTRVTTACRPAAGQVLSVRVADPDGQGDMVPTPGPLDIVYEDGDLLVLNKAPGVLVHPGPGHYSDTLCNYIAWYYKKAGISADVHPVQRLDKGTSGLLVVAKHPHAQEVLKGQLHTPAFRRVYLAVCDGGPQPPSGVVDAPLGPREGSLVEQMVRPDGKDARTRYETLSRSGGRSLVRLELDTGRTHQIRVHMASLGCPLTGDFLYGYEDRSLISRPALHSAQLSLRQPVTGQELSFTLPLPEDMARLLTHQKGEKEP